MPPYVPAEAAPPAPSRPDWAGEWLFVASRGTQSPGLYPPEYIEMRVTEDSGVLRGHYLGRYRVTDKALSPSVAFQFEGRAGADAVKLPWEGSGGAKGEVSLRLLANGAMEVTWTASRMGGELSLISGTAVLVRKAD